jgi:uncharacterized protein (DUF1697 family)
MSATPRLRIALLRGINVGAARRITMKDLSAAFVAAGCSEVRTLGASGNVLFTPPPRASAAGAARLRAALDAACGKGTRAVFLDAEELRREMEAHPLRSLAKEPARLLLLVAPDARAATAWKPLAREDWAPDALHLRGRFAWLWCAGGVQRSRLWRTADRAVPAATARNFSTLEKLLALGQEKAAPPRRQRRASAPD